MTKRKVAQNKMWRDRIDEHLDGMCSRKLFFLLDYIESREFRALVDPDLDVDLQERMGENPTLTAAEIKRERGQ